MEENKEMINIELCGGKMPEKAHSVDAAFDVFTREDFEVTEWKRYAIPLGFKIQLPKHLAAIIQSRGGMSLKGIPVVMVLVSGFKSETRMDADIKTGLVDSGYTGEVKVFVKTYGIDILGVRRMYIPAGTKIAQMRIVTVPSVELVEGCIDKNTERGENGFNSSGIR